MIRENESPGLYPSRLSFRQQSLKGKYVMLSCGYRQQKNTTSFLGFGGWEERSSRSR